jgi:hypothetical protein
VRDAKPVNDHPRRGRQYCCCNECGEDYVVEYMDPLLWWKDNQPHFPIMSELARILLCIQATSAPSEQIFSLASRVISKLRSSFNPDNVSHVVFVNGALDWYEQLP